MNVTDFSYRNILWHFQPLSFQQQPHFPLRTSLMENLYLTTKCETFILEHISFFFSSYLPITASFSLIMWLRKCSLKIWHWQMSNYRSYIHVSRLWLARPSISPADAGCKTWAASLSTQPPRKVACSVLACHPSPFPLDCRSYVTVPLTDHWPHRGHTGGWSNISLRSAASRQEERKSLRYLRSSDISIDTNHSMQGSSDILAAHLVFS